MTINKTKKSQPSTEQITHGHLNHMNGVSYDITNPITQLRIVASSCFFGEPMYYHDTIKRNDLDTPDICDETRSQKYLDETLGKGLAIPKYRSMSASRLMETAIDEALDFDPELTLVEASRLRNQENIRTTPQVIMVRAANHAKVRGTGLINKYFDQIMKRTDEAAVQLAYQTQVYGRPIPNALKKAWKKFLESCSEYQLAKYRSESREFKTVDVVNLVHAYSEGIDKLVKGTLKLSTEDTWEALISTEGSSKETWTKAIALMGHMALLRNLSNFHKHGVDEDLYLPKLINTAENGKQLPFRYYTAYQHMKGTTGTILEAIEKCLEISMKELPHFDGKVMSLCDNSGSAQGTTTSTLGTVRVADIANLTAVLTGKASDEGYVGVFGDKLSTFKVDKDVSVFKQTNHATRLSADIGMGTEHGIWLFFNNAIKTKEHWDHIFVYSDMQAGHGKLYGTSGYEEYLWQGTNYIDVAKLINVYRKKVNPNVKVYLVQVAGYRDTLVPEFYQNTYILGGWGDGVLRFADSLRRMNNG